MITSLNSHSNPSSPLKVTLLIETLMSGKIAASIAEFPTFRVEAETQESAVQQLQMNLGSRSLESMPMTQIGMTIKPRS